MKRFVLDVLRATLIYELITFGGLTVFLSMAPLFGYLPYSDRPGPGWFGRFPAIGWVEFWANTLAMARFSTFVAVLALQIAVPCAILVCAFYRLLKWPFIVRTMAVLVSAAGTFYIMPGLGWYASLGLPAMWVGVGFGAVAGFCLPPRRARVITSGA